MDLMTRRRALIAAIKRLVKLIVTGASGIVSFVTNVQKPMSVTCEFSPVQDLNGQTAPYPPGGGKNKINAPDVTQSSGGYLYNGDFVIPAGTYTISFSSSEGASTSATVALLDGEGNALTSGSHNIPWTFTTTAESASLKIYVSGAGTYSNIQIEAGSSATAYAPYSNICPISGWMGVDIEQRDTNLVATPYLKKISRASINNITEKKIVGNNYFNLFVIPIPKGTLYFHKTDSSTDTYFGFSNNPDLSSGDFLDDVVNFRWGTNKTYDNQNYKYAYITEGITSGIPTYSVSTGGYLDTVTPSIVQDSLPISWQSTAGTVYGGSITLNEDGSADLTGTCETYTVSGDSVHNASFTYTNVKYAEFQKPSRSSLNGISNASKICVCSIGSVYRTAGGFDKASLINQLVISAQGQYFWYGFDPETTLEEMKETLDGAVICYGLKPEYRPTYHFDNIGALQSFLGTNTVWHDMNGSISVEYYNKQ